MILTGTVIFALVSASRISARADDREWAPGGKILASVATHGQDAFRYAVLIFFGWVKYFSMRAPACWTAIITL